MSKCGDDPLYGPLPAMTEPMSAEQAWHEAHDAWYSCSRTSGGTQPGAKAATAIIQQYGDQRVAAALARLDDPALVEVVARALAVADGHEPDETWQEFDRNAAATDMMCGGISDDEIFPTYVRWKEYEYPATAAIAAIKEKLNGPA